jgi:hypothetical protein
MLIQEDLSIIKWFQKRRARGIVPTVLPRRLGTTEQTIRPQRSFILDISTSSNSDLFQSAAY